MFFFIFNFLTADSLNWLIIMKFFFSSNLHGCVFNYYSSNDFIRSLGDVRQIHLKTVSLNFQKTPKNLLNIKIEPAQILNTVDILLVSET